MPSQRRSWKQNICSGFYSVSSQKQTEVKKSNNLQDVLWVLCLRWVKLRVAFCWHKWRSTPGAGSCHHVSADLRGALICTLLVVDKEMPSFTPKCLWDSHHLDDFRYKASGALLLCLALGFAYGRKQLLNACTLGIQHDCMDRAPKHRMELWRHPQFFQNMNTEVQQPDLQDLVQQNAQEEC